MVWHMQGKGQDVACAWDEGGFSRSCWDNPAGAVGFRVVVNFFRGVCRAAGSGFAGRVWRGFSLGTLVRGAAQMAVFAHLMV